MTLSERFAKKLAKAAAAKKERKRLKRNAWNRRWYHMNEKRKRATARAARHLEIIAEKKARAQRRIAKAAEQEAKQKAKLEAKIPKKTRDYTAAYEDGKRWIVAQLQVLCPGCKDRLAFLLR